MGGRQDPDGSVRYDVPVPPDKTARRVSPRAAVLVAVLKGVSVRMSRMAKDFENAATRWIKADVIVN